MAWSVAGRPDNLQLAIANRDNIAIVKVLIRLRNRAIHRRSHPRRSHPFEWKFVDWKTVSLEKSLRFGTRRRRTHGQHPSDPFCFKLMQQCGGVATLFDYRGSAEMIDVMMRSNQQVQVFE